MNPNEEGKQNIEYTTQRNIICIYFFLIFVLTYSNLLLNRI